MNVLQKYLNTLRAKIAGKQNTKPMKEQIINVLNQLKYTFTITDKGSDNLIIVPFNSSNGRIDSFTEINEGRKVIRILTFLPITIPEHRKVEVMEFITRLNHLANLGYFEFNIDNGRLSYNCTFEFYPHDNIEKYYSSNFQTSVYKLDYYMPHILSIAYSNTSALEEFKKTQNLVNPTLN